MKYSPTLRKYVSLVILIGFVAWGGWYLHRHAAELGRLAGLSVGRVVLLLGLALLKLAAMGSFTKVVVGSLGIDLGFWEWFGLSAMTSMGNYLSPFRGGAAIRGVYLKARHGLPYSLFFSTLAILYVLSFSTNAVIGLLALVVLWAAFGVTDFALTGFLAACLVLPVLLWITVRRLPRLPGRWTEQLNRVIEGWQIVAARPGTLPLLLLLSVLNTGVTLLMIHFSFVAFGTHLPLTESLIASTLFLISAMIPITPAGLGIAEMMLVLASQTLGVEGMVSVLSAGLNRSAMIVVSLVLGPLFSYLLSKRGL
ncbi:MAG: lysylphosphatidylglycerol synthase transmembrane domain-containing protein [Chloroflexota bacterium]